MLSIISTVGTSVFGRYGTPLSDAVKQFEASNPTDIRSIPSGKSFPGEELCQQALALLEAQSNNLEFLRKASAELNAIEGIHRERGVHAGHEYYFLSSQTASGALAARVLAEFCKNHYQATRSEVRMIQGLQVANSRTFRLTGLPQLVQATYELIKDAKDRSLITILNPTGGFKATIPYLTLVGMLRQCEVSCIHETSEVLITLAGLPISLDLEGIQRIASVLEACEAAQDEGFERAELLKQLGLPRNGQIEDHPFWSLFEQFDADHYISSGLGSIALAEIRTHAKDQPVWLSKQAAERLKEEFKPGSEARRNFETIFNRIHEPSNRVPPYRHQYQGCRFPAYKYKGNERLFYYEHPDGYVLVLELAQHTSDRDWSYDRVPGELEAYSPAQLWKKVQQK